ncbi:hypothetical protein B0H16DRAFT_1814969 [Mycena metata]|uniref:Uncharacterized protein n=1 Tax=Mycena metata TaxID=1033252 RepID=A0AAD7H4E6_9AGAR|nr:hypothetical protein B0H16DRAFT_1814969 [Mycena metata]
MHYLKTLENGDANEVIGDNWSPKLNPVLPPLLRVFHALPPTFPAPVAAPLTHVIHSLITIPVSPPLCVEWFAASPRSSGTSSPKGKHVAAPAPPIFIPPSPRRTPTPPPPPAARTSLWGPAISSPLHSHAECALRAAAVRACTPPRCSCPHRCARRRVYPSSPPTPARPHLHLHTRTSHVFAGGDFARAKSPVFSLRQPSSPRRCANPPPLDLARTRTPSPRTHATPVSGLHAQTPPRPCTSQGGSGASTPLPSHARTLRLECARSRRRRRPALPLHAPHAPPRAPHHLHTLNEPRAAHTTSTPTLPQRAPALAFSTPTLPRAPALPSPRTQAAFASHALLPPRTRCRLARRTPPPLARTLSTTSTPPTSREPRTRPRAAHPRCLNAHPRRLLLARTPLRHLLRRRCPYAVCMRLHAERAARVRAAAHAAAFAPSAGAHT